MSVEEYRPLPLVLETWRRPSFEPARAWGVYVPVTEEVVPEAWALTVSSHLPIDFRMPEYLGPEHFQRAASGGGPGPLTARAVELPKLKLRNLLRAGRGAAISLHEEDRFVIRHDGTQYGFRWGTSYDSARASVEWWQEGPQEWRSFTKWVMELQDFLAKCAGQ